MLGDLSWDEVELLNAYHVLGPSGKKEMSDYLRYLLIKQYKKELIVSIFNNKLLQSLLHRLLHMVEREDFEISLIEKRVLQFKEIYFGTFEQVHCKYTELIADLDSYEVIRDFGKNSFENIMQSCSYGNRNTIRFEIIELGENFSKLARKKDARQIVAV